MGSPRIVFLFIFNFLISLAVAAPQDVCESCKPLEDCPPFTTMTKEQQQQWVLNYPCEGSKTMGSLVEGFSPVAKGDLVCCPSLKVWGISEDNAESPPESQNDVPTNPNSYTYNVPNYPWNNENQPIGNAYNQPQPRIPNNPQNMFSGGSNGGNGYGYNQCPAQSTPPTPESGCCGVETSVGDRIADVRQFLQSRSSSNWNTPSNYPRYPRDLPYLQRHQRDAPEDLGVTFEDRIAGGREADLDQYPWTVFLTISFITKKGKENFVCGGSLISSNFILTAAHCVVNDGGELNSIDVTLAEYDRRSFPNDCVKIRGQNQPICISNLKVAATDVYIHPQFVEQFLINDIALIKLRQNAPYTKYIRPICLPPINIDSPQFSDLPLATAGWGLNVSVESNIKQHTVVHMVPKKDCAVHYSRLTTGHLCASGKKAEDTCRGDSGGPLMMMSQGKFYVVGIVSGKTAAFQCGTPVPSLYTNVYNYLDWIRKYVR